MFIVTVSAGFSSPAEDYAEGPLDLNRYLVPRPTAMFFVRVKENSMTGVGIFASITIAWLKALDFRLERTPRLSPMPYPIRVRCFSKARIQLYFTGQPS